jgi:hypothetical protein
VVKKKWAVFSHFFHLVHILKLSGLDMARIRTSPAAIVKHLDIINDISSRFLGSPQKTDYKARYALGTI